MAAEEDRVRYFAVLSVGEFLENNRKTYLKVKAGLCLDVIDASTRAEPQSKLQPYIYIRAPDWAVATSEEGDRFRNALFPEDLAEDGQLRVVRVNLDAFRPTNKRKMVALDTYDDPPQVWDPEVHGQVALVRPYLVVSRDQDDKVLMVQSVNSPLGQEFQWKVVEHNLFGWTSLSRSAREIIQGLSPDEVYDLRGALGDSQGNPDWRECLWNTRFYGWMEDHLGKNGSSDELYQAILEAIPEHPHGERVWVPPGGTVLAKDDKDLYETVLDSLYREWREETGMDITQDELRMELPEEELVYWQSGDRSIKFVAEGRAPDSLLQELPEQEEWAGIGDVLRVAWRDRDDCSFLCDQSSS